MLTAAIMTTDSIVATQPPSGASHRLDKAQTSKASSALIKHILSEQAKGKQDANSRDLLADNDSKSDPVPIWLCLTTKRHIVDRARLKPSLVTIPHPFTISSSPIPSICLITADPQRSVKDLVASPDFPASLRAQISRVIGFSKLRAKYKSFESRRQLLAEYDVFVADDRISPDLLPVLGKTFFKATTKRPIPVRIAPSHSLGEPDKDKKSKADPMAPKQRRDFSSSSGSLKLAAPDIVASRIVKAIGSAVVCLTPSTATSVRIGKSDMPAEHLVENIEAVVKVLMEKHVPKGWQGTRSLHIKGPTTAALPIWLADQLWIDKEEDVVDAPAAIKDAKPARKLLKEAPKTDTDAGSAGIKVQGKKKKRARDKPEGDDDKGIGEKKLKKMKLKSGEETRAE